MEAFEVKFETPRQSLHEDLSDWIFVTHETMWLLYHHRSEGIVNQPAGFLDTPENFVWYIKELLGHEFTPLDLHKLFHTALIECARLNKFKSFQTRAGGREDLPAFILTDFVYEWRSDGKPLVIAGRSDMNLITSALGVPRLDETTPVFGYFLNLDSTDTAWADALITRLSVGEELAPLQKAALLERLRIC